MFVGSEIIEESKDELIVQCLSSYGDLPAPKVISRMSLIAKLMLRDAVDSLKGRDPALAEEIIRRDEEVDRFYLFIIRQLAMAGFQLKPTPYLCFVARMVRAVILAR